MIKKVFIISHSSEIEGPIDYYIKYLKKNKYSVSKLEHPLDDYRSRFTIFSSQGKIAKIKRFNYFSIVNLFIDFLLSIRFVLENKFDVFIGANNFDTFVGILSRNIFRKRIGKIIYFGSDFSENRFTGTFFNKIYYLVELICCRYSDLVISNSRRAAKKRLEFGLKKQKSIIVPNGVLLDREDFNKKELNKNNFIFVGSVTREHGLYDLIKCICPLMNKLVLIGYGADWDRVLSICKEKNIKIETHYKKDHNFCVNYMKQFKGFGLAPYNNDSKWTYYCSPLKVVEYIACGLPVLMSSLPEIADYIVENKFGIIYKEMNYSEINNSLKTFNTNDFYLKASQFYDIYNQNNLYSKIKL